MGTRNFDLGARDMKAAGRFALKLGMSSFTSIDTMSDRWNLFVDYIHEHHAIGRMEMISQDVVIEYGSWLADRVDEDELEVATAQNYVSAVNRVLEIARGDNTLQVSPTQDCGIPKRSGVATENMAVSDEVHNLWVRLVHPRIAAMLDLQRWFGLRFEESAKFDAHAAKCEMASGQISVSEGTKGGRQRQVSCSRAWQFVTIARAAKMQENSRSMIFSAMSYREFRQYCYRMSTQHGIRFHRERHAFAQRRYWELVGEECPVVGNIGHGQAHLTWLAQELRIDIDEAKQRDASARDRVAQELGHSRIEVTNAYLG